MRQVTTEELAGPARGLDPEVVEFRAQFGNTSPLDELVRHGAQQMLQSAIEMEVDDFLAQHAQRRDTAGRRQVVRNGYLPSREILTGAGRLAVEQPRVRDNSTKRNDRIRFSSSILPPYLRRSAAIDELIPWLYLKGISTGDFTEALQALVGECAPALSANVVVRLTAQWGQEYDDWSRRDLSEKRYVYVWADGIHVNVRLENEANQRQCLLVLMGATADGQKELITVVDGYRESEQSWYELLLDLKNRGLALAPKLAVGDGALGFWAALPSQPSIPSWKSTRPSTRRPANAFRRIATRCWRSTTSRPNIGSTSGPQTPLSRRSPRFAYGIDAPKAAAAGAPAWP
jgi:transposase-like protein